MAPLRTRTLEDEAYRLTVTDKKLPEVHIRSRAPWGAMHALSTLRFLMQVEHTVETGEVRVSLPVCDIKDKPAHAHRALLVPYVRDPHIMEFTEENDPFGGSATSEISEIFQWIDLGVQLKFNMLHWEVLVPNEEKFVHFLDLMRVTAGYAARRGMQLMPQVDLGHPGIPEGKKALFLRRLGQELQGTCALVHLGPRGRRALRAIRSYAQAAGHQLAAAVAPTARADSRARQRLLR